MKYLFLKLLPTTKSTFLFSNDSNESCKSKKLVT